MMDDGPQWIKTTDRLKLIHIVLYILEKGWDERDEIVGYVGKIDWLNQAHCKYQAAWCMHEQLWSSYNHIIDCLMQPSFLYIYVTAAETKE